MITLKVNGETREYGGDGDMPLLWFLRDLLGLTGTKYSCGIGSCGTCTVLMNGTPMRSCVMPAIAAAGTEITTIEGLGTPDSLSAVQSAWIEHQVAQCGYCQPGMIMSAAALLNENASPSDADIDANITNICRCGTFNRVRRGIQLAAQIMMSNNKDGKSS